MARIQTITANAVQKPTWHGVVLVAGGAVGAGMFALPMVSAGAWTLWSMLGLVVVWWFTYLAAKLLLDTNLALLPASQAADGTRLPAMQGPPVSFDTLVRKLMGPRWATINNLSLVFIMMILMYAYISAGASIISVNLNQLGVGEDKLNQLGLEHFRIAGLGLNRAWLSLGFSCVIALVIWLGTALVARVSVAFMVLMAASFALTMFALIPHIDMGALLVSDSSFVSFLWAALPVYITAFACAGLVPSLVKHYQNYMPVMRKLKVQRCLFWGTLLALFIYLLWLTTTFGVIARPDYKPVIAAGGNTGDLVQALANIGGAENRTQQLMTWFSHCAIITSFLGVALGLVHFVQDRLRLSDNVFSRAYAILICFIPPTIASFFYPKGFLVAIGYAGFFVSFSFFVMPVIMAIKRIRFGHPATLPWLKTIIALVLFFGLSVAALKVASLSGLLPMFA